MCAPAFWVVAAVLLTSMLAAGCAAEPAQVVPTKEILLESLVAEAVETQRAQTLQVDQRAATLTVAAGQPAVLQAQTLTPTITPTPEASPTPLTPIPTLPIFDTATPTPPSAPTRQPGDPALRLGDPDWTEPFDSGENWSEFSTSHSQAKILDGKMFYTVFSPGSGPTWTVSWPVLSNFYLEVLAKTPSVCGGKDRFGLVFRSPDPSKGYRFEISCDGQYSAWVFNGTSSQMIVAWASSDDLLAGPNQINRIGVWAQGKVLSFNINGKTVAGLEHNDYRSGTFGLTVTSEQTQNFTVVFDELSFWSFE
ncbi:MAG: hypothetical protein P8Y72_17235 [Anaerolineales bacterium]